MRWVADVAYLLVAALTAPAWLVRLLRTGKYRTDWPARFGYGPELPIGARQRVMFHAVSVGEVNAIREVVNQLAEHHNAEIVIATTTDTGYTRARQLFHGTHHVVRYPFDSSRAVNRFLRRVRPNVVALVELEVWPNFTAACTRRAIPVGVINGRLTERSARRYARIRPLIRPSFQRLSFVAVQDETYAARFRMLGVEPEVVEITGTTKWDAARIADSVEGAAELASALGIDPRRPLVVAGSTAPDEHQLLHDAVPPGVQLLCAPRRPEWFDDATAVFPDCVRRTTGAGNAKSDRFLLDTIGELRRAYALADIVVVGRSFGELHGSDLVEPIALGKPTIIGPAVSDFRNTVDALLAGRGIIQTTRDELPDVIRALLDDPDRRAELAQRGREVIRANQGASKRCAEIIARYLNPE